MENFGVDLSSVAGGFGSKNFLENKIFLFLESNGSTDKKVPEIAASIDSAAPDYYSSFGEEKVAAAQIPKSKSEKNKIKMKIKIQKSIFKAENLRVFGRLQK